MYFSGENLGQISEENPTFLSVVKEGHLQLNYSDGDMCRIKGSTSLMNTIINFICDSSEEVKYFVLYFSLIFYLRILFYILF